MQQIQMECGPCNGTGARISVVCQVCTGCTYTEEQTTIRVPLKSTTVDGQKFKFTSKGHEVKGAFGDIIVTISTKKHPVFTRKGSDLHLTKTVTLVEALCGFEDVIQHVNGKSIPLKFPGCIQPDSVQIIPRLGMSIRHALHVTFRVVLPSTFLTKYKEDLITVLAHT